MPRRRSTTEICEKICNGFGSRQNAANSSSSGAETETAQTGTGKEFVRDAAAPALRPVQQPQRGGRLCGGPREDEAQKGE